MRVLLVEDEGRIADFIRKGLSEYGYAVDSAGDGEEALDWLDAAEFDIIILDVMLPLRDGVEVCRELRIARPVIDLSGLPAGEAAGAIAALPESCARSRGSWIWSP